MTLQEKKTPVLPGPSSAAFGVCEQPKREVTTLVKFQVLNLHDTKAPEEPRQRRRQGPEFRMSPHRSAGAGRAGDKGTEEPRANRTDNFCLRPRAAPPAPRALYRDKPTRHTLLGSVSPRLPAFPLASLQKPKGFVRPRAFLRLPALPPPPRGRKPSAVAGYERVPTRPAPRRLPLRPGRARHCAGGRGAPGTCSPGAGSGSGAGARAGTGRSRSGSCAPLSALAPPGPGLCVRGSLSRHGGTSRSAGGMRRGCPRTGAGVASGSWAHTCQLIPDGGGTGLCPETPAWPGHDAGPAPTSWHLPPGSVPVPPVPAVPPVPPGAAAAAPPTGGLFPRPVTMETSRSAPPPRGLGPAQPMGTLRLAHASLWPRPAGATNGAARGGRAGHGGAVARLSPIAGGQLGSSRPMARLQRGRGSQWRGSTKR